MYTIHIPAAPLRGYIECYWFLQENLITPAKLEEYIFTDARADIVFSCDSPYQRLRDSVSGTRRSVSETAHSASKTMRCSNLDAQRSYPVRIAQYGQIHLVGVRFRPGGLAAFLPMPAHQLEGQTLGLEESFGRPCVELEQRLFDSQLRREEQAVLLDHFFLEHLRPPDRHALVRQIASTIEQRRGVIKMGQLSRDFGYSLRTLDRMFLDILGFTPKFYARIARFRHAMEALVRDQRVDWADIVAACGYYDQAHFIKEFVAFSGLQPEAYRARLDQQNNTCAPNYVQFLQENQG